ncbi:MAG: CRISPR-associated endonuclease Cas2 [Acidimicrobiales bacterium]
MSRRRWLVAYDIANDARLRKVHKTVKAHGEQLQFSVYVCDLSHRELLGLKTELRDVIHHSDDRVVLIDLGDATGAGPRIDHLGQVPNLPSDQGATVV